MRVQLVTDKAGARYWLASGVKKGRKVLAEGPTRKDAVRRWCENPEPKLRCVK